MLLWLLLQATPTTAPQPDVFGNPLTWISSGQILLSFWLVYYYNVVAMPNMRKEFSETLDKTTAALLIELQEVRKSREKDSSEFRTRMEQDHKESNGVMRDMVRQIDRFINVFDSKIILVQEREERKPHHDVPNAGR